jgi:hypothetical protein
MTSVATFAAGIAATAQELNDDTVSPGLLGLGVVVALGVATWLLIRSMNRQLRKIDFDEGDRPRKSTDERANQAAPDPRDPPGRAG